MTTDELSIDFDPMETLGFLITDWVEHHFKVPGGIYDGEPLVFNGWQLYCVANHYRIKPKAVADPRKLAAPFIYRRSVVVGPQKCGKSPWGAAMILAEGIGPSLFSGWARGGEIYSCRENGCPCGWVYEYERGEAMGVARSKSLIGLLAFAESQTQNVYEPLQTLIHNSPMEEFVKVREGFIRLPNHGKIVPLTSKARSKLGQPLTSGLGDESGLYTLENGVLTTWQTMRRGIAAMQGRTIELTNPWDPMENSAAQQAFESQRPDIFKYYRKPPADLSYSNKRERHKIHLYVYSDAPWVDVGGIDAEAAELIETDPTQAERFYGNRLVQGLGSYLTEMIWDRQTRIDVEIIEREPVCGGFDGSRSGDWTAIRLETREGFRFTPTYGEDERPTFWRPEQWPEGRIPRGEVNAALDWIMGHYRVKRFYCDPRHFETQVEQWASEYGEDVVIEWPTNSINRMYPALIRYREDLVEGLITQSDDAVAKTHAMSARKVSKPGDKFILGKPSENQKIDIVMADILAHEAASDARASGWAIDERSIFFLS